MVLAIDPGPTISGTVLMDGFHIRHASAVESVNLFSLQFLFWSFEIETLSQIIVEGMSFQGKMAGGEVIATAMVIGKIDGYFSAKGIPVSILTRHEVLRRLQCSKDAEVRALMIERYGPPKIKEFDEGKKKIVSRPGPTANVTSHCWQALGLYEAWTRGK